MSVQDGNDLSSLSSDYIIGKSDFKTIDIDKKCRKLAERKSYLGKLSVVFLVVSTLFFLLNYFLKNSSQEILNFSKFIKTNASKDMLYHFITGGGGIFLLGGLSFFILYCKQSKDFDELKLEIKNHWKRVHREAIESWFSPISQGSTYFWKDLFLELGGDEFALKMLVSAGIVSSETGRITKDGFKKLEPIIRETGGIEAFIEQSSIKGKYDDVTVFLNAFKQANTIPIGEFDLKSEIESIDIKNKILARGGIHVLDELAQSVFDCGLIVPVVVLVKIPSFVRQRRRIYTYMSKVFVNKSQTNVRTNVEFACDVVLPTAGKIIGSSVGFYGGLTAGTAAVGYLTKEVFDKGSKVAAVGGAASVAGVASGAGATAMGVVLTAAPYLIAGGAAIAGGIYLGRFFKKIGQKIKLWHFEKAQQKFLKALEDFYIDQVKIFHSNGDDSPIKSLGLIKRLQLQFSILKEALEGDFKEHDDSLTKFHNIFGKLEYEHPVVLILKDERRFSKERLLEFESELKRLNNTYKKGMSARMADINLGLKLYSETQRVTEFNKNELVYRQLKIAEENYSKEIILLKKEYGDQVFKKVA